MKPIFFSAVLSIFLMQGCGTDKDVVVPEYKTEANTQKTASENTEELENNEEVTEAMET